MFLSLHIGFSYAYHCWHLNQTVAIFRTNWDIWDGDGGCTVHSPVVNVSSNVALVSFPNYAKGLFFLGGGGGGSF